MINMMNRYMSLQRKGEAARVVCIVLTALAVRVVFRVSYVTRIRVRSRGRGVRRVQESLKHASTNTEDKGNRMVVLIRKIL
jgi:hypothetical protein